MMDKPIPLKFKNDGRVDAEALESVINPESLRQWMLSRLQGSDPLLPIDRQYMEARESVFIYLWHDAKPSGNVRYAMGLVCAELLRLAWESDPADWIRVLLDLVGAIRPTLCEFFLTSIVLHDSFPDAYREDEWKRRWLHAAAAYPVNSAEQIQAWRQWLAPGKYPVIAYRALSHDLELAVWYLPAYWQSFSFSDRPFFLKNAVRALLAHGHERITLTFQKWREHLGQVTDFCQAVDAVLEELGCPPAFAARPGKPEPVCIDKQWSISKLAGIATA